SRLGRAYVELHESMGPQRRALERGLELLRAALADRPGDRTARFRLASAEVARHRGDLAVPHFHELLRQEPDWHRARFRLAIACDQLGRYAEATAEYERVVRAAPDWLEPYPLLARLYLSRGDGAAAGNLLERQLEYREDALALVNLALAGHLQGRPLETSLEAIERALKLDPRFAPAFVARGWLQARAGRFKSAARDYREALRLDPHNLDAQAGLQAIPPDAGH
ncbi:MAG: tetratricopeptide repeat protein, partial [Planctomycetes bacterium]|nr:tetratricopeptide repeat protein [Planctomycetota bacterium]